jgi:hypothetical protein
MPFVKGDPRINRKGRPINPEPELLREALRREGERRGEGFWDKVAEYAFKDKGVMIAVIKKFIPDMSVTELNGNMTFTLMENVKVQNRLLEYKFDRIDSSENIGYSGETNSDSN